MEWFGWLTKGVCQVSALDKLILVGEIIGLLIIGAGFYLIFHKDKK